MADSAKNFSVVPSASLQVPWQRSSGMISRIGQVFALPQERVCGSAEIEKVPHEGSQAYRADEGASR